MAKSIAASCSCGAALSIVGLDQTLATKLYLNFLDTHDGCGNNPRDLPVLEVPDIYTETPDSYTGPGYFLDGYRKPR